MPRIENANGLSLSDIVNQLLLNDAQDSRELRSTGNDLYVKEGKAAHTNLISRKLHRDNAIELIRHSLAKQFNTTIADARQIMTNVFGHTPSQLTVSDVWRLHGLGEKARHLIAAGTLAVTAFAEAAKENERPDHQGRLETSIPLTDSALPSENDEIHSEATINRPGNSAENSEDFIEPLQPPTATGPSGVTPPERADSTAASSPDETQLTREEASDLLGTMGRLMAGFSPYDSIHSKRANTWLTFAEKLGKPGLFPTDLLQSLPIDQRISMQLVLADHLSALRGNDDTIPDQTELARAIVTFNKTYVMSEMMPDMEVDMLNDCLSQAGRNPILRDAYAHWTEMDRSQRETAIQTLIDLHAEQFGYAGHKPILELEHIADPNEGGNSNRKGIKINTNSDNFNNFREVFNTVIHESTHWYQYELTSRLNRGQIDVASPIYHQAWILFATQTFLIDENYLSGILGFSRTDAFDGYRRTPDEQHAFAAGDHAGACIEDIFAPHELSGETEEQ